MKASKSETSTVKQTMVRILFVVILGASIWSHQGVVRASGGGPTQMFDRWSVIWFDVKEDNLLFFWGDGQLDILKFCAESKDLSVARSVLIPGVSSGIDKQCFSTYSDGILYFACIDGNKTAFIVNCLNGDIKTVDLTRRGISGRGTISSDKKGILFSASSYFAPFTNRDGSYRREIEENNIAVLLFEGKTGYWPENSLVYPRIETNNHTRIGYSSLLLDTKAYVQMIDNDVSYHLPPDDRIIWKGAPFDDTLTSQPYSWLAPMQYTTGERIILLNYAQPDHSILCINCKDGKVLWEVKGPYGFNGLDEQRDRIALSGMVNIIYDTKLKRSVCEIPGEPLEVKFADFNQDIAFAMPLIKGDDDSTRYAKGWIWLERRNSQMKIIDLKTGESKEIKISKANIPREQEQQSPLSIQSVDKRLSPNEIYSVRMWIEDSSESDSRKFISRYVYECYDEKTSKTLWIRKQVMVGPEEEMFPLEVYVSDDAWAAIWTQWNRLIIVDEHGKDRCKYDILNDCFDENQRKQFVHQTTAGPMWSGNSMWYFHKIKNNMCFVVKPWWGQRFAIEIETGTLLKHAQIPVNEALKQEQQIVLKKLENVAEALDKGILRDHCDAGEALYFAGQLRIKEAIPYLRKFEDNLGIRSSTSGGGRFGYKPQEGRVDRHDWETYGFRQLSHLSLRRLGEVPGRFPCIQFDIHYEDYKKEYLYLTPPLNMDRTQGVKKVKKGMEHEKVLGFIGSPDFNTPDIWYYEMDAADPYTLEIKWKEDGLVVEEIIKHRPPIYTTDKWDEELAY